MCMCVLAIVPKITLHDYENNIKGLGTTVSK